MQKLLTLFSKDKLFLKFAYLSIALCICLTLLGLLSSNCCFAVNKNGITHATTEQFMLWSTTFKSGQNIPKRYTADGTNVSPQLSWTGAPKTTKSFALICEDPDAPGGTWIHWLIYDIPPESKGLPQGVPVEATLKNQSKQAANGFRNIGYGGPSPPPGSPHHYYFKLYALDSMFGYDTIMTLYKFRDFVQKHSLAEADIMGTYGR